MEKEKNTQLIEHLSVLALSIKATIRHYELLCAKDLYKSTRDMAKLELATYRWFLHRLEQIMSDNACALCGFEPKKQKETTLPEPAAFKLSPLSLLWAHAIQCENPYIDEAKKHKDECGYAPKAETPVDTWLKEHGHAEMHQSEDTIFRRMNRRINRMPLVKRQMIALDLIKKHFSDGNILDKMGEDDYTEFKKLIK